jgi:hypothetical protein
MYRGDRCHDDQINIGGFHARLLHGISGGVGGHVAGMLTLSRDSPLLDSRAGSNPFVARLNDFFEIGVRQDPLRHITAGSNNGNCAARLAGPRPRDFLHGSA